jgi:hypothetical protein
MIVHSQLPVLSAKVKFLIDKEIPSIHSHSRLQWGDVVEVMAVYPSLPLQKIDTAQPDILGERRDIEPAQDIAAPESPRTPRLYDCIMDDVMLGEGERISI